MTPTSYYKLDRWASTYLQTRAVPPDVAHERGYRSVLQGKKEGGPEFAAAYGFSRKAAGLLIPLHGVFDDYPHDSVQLRLAPEVVPSFTTPKGKERKFLVPAGQKNVLATAPRTRDQLSQPRHGLFVCEGVTRIDALAAFNLPAVGMSGVWNWKSLVTLPDFNGIAIRDSRVVIVPDGDVRVRKRVYEAVKNLAGVLDRKRAAEVWVVGLPDNLGLDDWIAANEFESAEQLMHAMRDLFVDLTRLKEPAPDSSLIEKGIFGGTSGEHSTPDMLDRGRAALIAEYGKPDRPGALFKRDNAHGDIVRVEGDRIQQLTSAELDEPVRRSAEWWHFNKDGAPVPAWPDKRVVSAIISDPSLLALPILLGVRPYPVLVQDETGDYRLLNSTGYHRPGWYVSKTVAADNNIPYAKSLLIGRGTGILSDFPFDDDDGEGEFVNGASVAHALAHLLTLLVKPVLRATPLFMY